MPNIELSAEELMRTVNAGVVEKYRQRAVCLRFKAPVPLINLEHIVRIRLTEEQLKKGDTIESTYRILTSAPRCEICGSATEIVRNIPSAYRCSASTCPANHRPIHSPHMSGVVEIKHHSTWVARHDETTWTDYEIDRRKGNGYESFDRRLPIIRKARMPCLSACLAVLDRQYDATVLAAVYRSCGTIGEMQKPGWQLTR